MTVLSDRVECKQLLNRLISPEAAARLVTDRSTIAVSGFTKSGEPKVFLPALARYLAEHAPSTRIALFSGASLSEEVEGPLAPFIGKRGPYMSSVASRKLIHAGAMEFTVVGVVGKFTGQCRRRVDFLDLFSDARDQCEFLVGAGEALNEIVNLFELSA